MQWSGGNTWPETVLRQSDLSTFFDSLLVIPVRMGCRGEGLACRPWEVWRLRRGVVARHTLDRRPRRGGVDASCILINHTSYNTYSQYRLLTRLARGLLAALCSFFSSKLDAVLCALSSRANSQHLCREGIEEGLQAKLVIVAVGGRCNRLPPGKRHTIRSEKMWNSGTHKQLEDREGDLRAE